MLLALLLPRGSDVLFCLFVFPTFLNRAFKIEEVLKTTITLKLRVNSLLFIVNIIEEQHVVLRRVAITLYSVAILETFFIYL